MICAVPQTHDWRIEQRLCSVNRRLEGVWDRTSMRLGEVERGEQLPECEHPRGEESHTPFLSRPSEEGEGSSLLGH